MEQWIFKVIYYPIFFFIIVASLAVIGLIFKDTGWNVPYRWIVIIGVIAYIADNFVNKG